LQQQIKNLESLVPMIHAPTLPTNANETITAYCFIMFSVYP
jgi:hypothetical protein